MGGRSHFDYMDELNEEFEELLRQEARTTMWAVFVVGLVLGCGIGTLIGSYIL